VLATHFLTFAADPTARASQAVAMRSQARGAKHCLVLSKSVCQRLGKALAEGCCRPLQTATAIAEGQEQGQAAFGTASHSAASQKLACAQFSLLAQFGAYVIVGRVCRDREAARHPCDMCVMLVLCGQKDLGGGGWVLSSRFFRMKQASKQIKLACETQLWMPLSSC